MKNMNAILIGLLLLPGPVALLRAAEPQESFREAFKLLLERNIFSKDRRPYQPPAERPTYEPPPPPPIESTLVLTGISRQQGETLAFIEDTRTGLIERYGLNSPVGRGHVQAITLDYLIYALPVEAETTEPNATTASVTAALPPAPRTTKVVIGQTLLGEAASGRPTNRIDGPVPPSAAPAGENSPRDSSPPAPTETGEESDILKRLLERRRQELQN